MEPNDSPPGDRRQPVICAYEIDSTGNAEALTLDQLNGVPASGSWRWIHLDRLSDGTIEWLHEQSGLRPIYTEALLADESRPRAGVFDTGTLINLRGVNLNPGADPEDMVSIRLWVEDNRVISIRARRLLAVQDIRDACDNNRAPVTPGEFLVDLALALTDRMNPIIHDIEDAVDELEETSTTAPQAELREKLIAVRRQAIPLRRYLSPQRDALSQILSARVAWLDDTQRGRMREAADRVTRFVEELDAIRERAGLLHEELSNRLSERMNNNMYVLSIVAVIFLPLGLITGLLGINVGGIPGAENKWAFLAVCAGLGALALGEFIYMRKKGWF